ncbi:unnamed protein product [Effrenium voratum]|nr:unnamed protein product [Effrenium voratum]
MPGSAWHWTPAPRGTRGPFAPRAPWGASPTKTATARAARTSRPQRDIRGRCLAQRLLPFCVLPWDSGSGGEPKLPGQPGLCRKLLRWSSWAAGGLGLPDVLLVDHPRHPLAEAEERHSPGERAGMQKEELPCHLGRIYLQGSNSLACPWQLPELPGWLEEEVSGEAWAEIREAIAKLKVKSWERWLDALWLVSPLWSDLLAWRQRRKRQKLVVQWVRAAETGLWKDSSEQFSARFACDPGAVSAHLDDIFDFSRSPLDWVPSDLRDGEQILVAEGCGTWNSPLELNVGDPLLMGVAQTQGPHGPVGAQAVYALVCTFNLFSRLVPHCELAAGGGPGLARLKLAVEEGCQRLHFQAVAEVKISRTRGGEQPFAPTPPASFTDLVQLPRADRQMDSAEDLKLCLHFRSGGNVASQAFFGGGEMRFRYLQKSLIRLRVRVLLRWVCSPAQGISSLLVSLMLLMLVLWEGMLAMVLASGLRQLEGNKAFWTWLLLPSLFGPLSPLLGLLALLLQWPLLHRLHAEQALRAALNVLLVWLLYFHVGLLRPLMLSFLLHTAACYFAALYAGLEMSISDLALANDMDASLLAVQRPSSRPPQHSEICMSILPGKEPGRWRHRTDSVESFDAGANLASPF